MVHDPAASRRTVLAALGSVPLGSMSLAAALEPSAAGRSRGGDVVVVIGAGMAGIAAADRLRRDGYDVRVVEARGRIGGRIHTWRGWHGAPLDLGASWIHGYAAGNPITPIAHRAGAELVPSSYSSSRLSIDPALRSAGVTRPHNPHWAGVVTRAEHDAVRRPHDESLARAVHRRVAGDRLSATRRDELAFYLNANYTTEWGEDPERLSARTVDQGKEYGKTGEDAFFPHGYDRVPHYLARHLRVDTGVVVRRVVLRAHGVDVHTSRGTLRARAVVVTVPLGVLQHADIEFVPGLPARHHRAVDRLGMGVLSKTFLRFEKPFWPVDVDWREYLGPHHGAWGEWFSTAKAGPPVILCFHGGDRARALEKARPADTRGEAMAVLRTMFGRHVPDPVASTTTGWSYDRWSHGSYSTNAVGSTRADRVALGASVDRRLFFAGEATEPDYSSTVHGAYLTGLRAAHEVAAALG